MASQQSGAPTETHSEPHGGSPAAAHAGSHAADGMVGAHGSTDDHGGDHGHDDHAHGSAATLGPVDVRAWSYGLVGIVLGLAVAVAMALSSGSLKL